MLNYVNLVGVFFFFLEAGAFLDRIVCLFSRLFLLFKTSTCALQNLDLDPKLLVSDLAFYLFILLNSNHNRTLNRFFKNNCSGYLF